MRCGKRPGWRTVRLHDLRHTFVSTLLALGVPPRTVMELAGHSAVTVTMTVYGHVQLDAIRHLDASFGGTAVNTSRQNPDPGDG
jgi:integrase